MKYRTAKTLTLLVLGICSLTTLNAQIDEDIRGSYQTQLDKTELEHELATLRLFKFYQESLEQLYGRAQQAGDLDLLTTVSDEQNRVKESRTLPDENSSEESIATLQEILEREIRSLEVEKAKKILDASKTYYGKLEEYEKSLVTSDQIEKAIQVRKIRTELPASDLVKNARELVESATVVKVVHNMPQVKIPKEAVKFQNRHYLFVIEEKTYEQAKADCLSRGGRLVQTEDEEINSFISKQMMKNSTRWIWIGLTDVEKEGHWVWGNGQEATYTNWRKGEPNNYRGNEDYAAMNFRGGWNDYPSDRKFHYICEWGP